MENQGQLLAVLGFSKTLQMLDGELIQMDETLFPITEEPRSNDRIIGVMTPWMRKLYALQKFYHRRLDEYVIAHKWMVEEEQKKSWPIGAELISKREMMLKILWASVQDEFNCWNTMHIAFRKGWYVVEEAQDGDMDQRLRQARDRIAKMLGMNPEDVMEL